MRYNFKQIIDNNIYRKIRLIFCFFIVAIFSIFEPLVLWIWFKIFKKKTKIFISLNKFLTRSNRLCGECNDHLDLDTNLIGWIKGICSICNWVYYHNKK